MVNVGNEEDLIKKIESNRFVLVRAINDGELQQLIKDGPGSFIMHYGTFYESGYGIYVKPCAQERTGTIIVLDNISPEDQRFEFLTRQGAYKLHEDITTKVDVFNISGLNWDQITEARTKESPLDRIARDFFAQSKKNYNT